MLLTEEQERIRETARDFAARALLPHAAEWEREAAFPRAALRELGKLGFMGMTVPEEWDGVGADYVAYALAIEEIAAGDGAVSTIMSGHNSVGCMPLVQYGTHRAEGEISAADGARRDAERLLPHRAAERFRCRRDPHARRAPARQLYPERHQAIHHLRHECRGGAGVRRDRSRARQARHQLLPGGHQGCRLSGVAGRGEDGPARLRHLRNPAQ